MYTKNTLIMWILGFVPQIIISLLLGAWFSDPSLRLKGQRFFKTVIYLPNLIMASAFAMLFFTLFSDGGPINEMLMQIGILKEPYQFLTNVWSTRGLVALMNFLMWFGNTTILLMAGMMGIDTSLFEAAEVDGATSTQVFFKICLLYTSDAADDLLCVDLGGRRLIKKKNLKKKQQTIQSKANTLKKDRQRMHDTNHQRRRRREREIRQATSEA